MVGGCKECPYVTVCHGNLTAKRVYVVINVKDKVVDCRISGWRSQLVEVELAAVDAAVNSACAIDGALIRFKPQSCSNLECKKFNACVPQTLTAGATYKVKSIHESFVCPSSGKRLVRVSLLPHDVQGRS